MKNFLFGICLTVFIFAPLKYFSLKVYSIPSPSNSSSLTAKNIVSGTISYREKIALPPEAIIKIKLLDVSLQDVPAVEISSQTITTNGQQVPINFELPFQSEQIQNNHQYVVRAEIYIQNQLSFTTTQSYPVITRNNGTEVDLVLQKVQSLSLENQLNNTKWLLEDLGGKGVIDRLQTTLEFRQDNRLSGNGGCNRYFGSYNFDGQNFTVNGIGSTFKMCSTAIMNQETQFLKALEKAKTIRLEGSFLLIDSEELPKPLKFTQM